MKSFRMIAAIASLALGIAAPSAGNAATLSLSLASISGFTQLSSSDPGTVTINNGIIPAGTAVTISSIFVPPQSGAQSVDVGLAGLSTAFNAGDNFALVLKNNNENSWTFKLVAVTDVGTFMSAASTFAPGITQMFTAALGGVSGIISSVYFVISGSVPFPDGDRTAEYQISTVPLPAAFLLFGSALLGLAGASRKRAAVV